MRKLHENGYNDTDLVLSGLVKVGYCLNDGDAVLDYGCGQGALVYRLRELGYDARGFDLHRTVTLQGTADGEIFSFADNSCTDPSNTNYDPSLFKVGFPDNMFDLVISTSVLEHVMDLGPVMAEIARVLKPGGVALHLYPTKKRFWVEPHMLVPLGAAIQKRWWFYLWALAGVRNQFQQNMTATEVADNNMLYCKTGLRYWSADEILTATREHFGFTHFATEQFHAGASRGDAWRRGMSALRSRNRLANLALIPRLDCVLTARKL